MKLKWVMMKMSHINNFFQVGASIFLTIWLSSAKAADSTTVLPFTTMPANTTILASGIFNGWNPTPSIIPTNIKNPCPPNTTPYLWAAVKNTGQAPSDTGTNVNFALLNMNVSLWLDYSILQQGGMGLETYDSGGGLRYYGITMSWSVYCVPTPNCTPFTTLPQQYPSCFSTPPPACMCQ